MEGREDSLASSLAATPPLSSDSTTALPGRHDDAPGGSRESKATRFAKQMSKKSRNMVDYYAGKSKMSSRLALHGASFRGGLPGKSARMSASILASERDFSQSSRPLASAEAHDDARGSKVTANSPKFVSFRAAQVEEEAGENAEGGEEGEEMDEEDRHELMVSKLMEAVMEGDPELLAELIDDGCMHPTDGVDMVDMGRGDAGQGSMSMELNTTLTGRIMSAVAGTSSGRQHSSSHFASPDSPTEGDGEGGDASVRGRTASGSRWSDGLISGMATLTGQLKAARPRGKVTGVTPLMMATKNGDLPCMVTLLEAGADPCRQDSAGRSSWYFPFFGHRIPQGSHSDICQVLLRYTPQEELSSGLFLMAIRSSEEGVAKVILDSLQMEIISKDMVGTCFFSFAGLELLDDPMANLTLPTGSAEEGIVRDTALSCIVRKRRTDLLVHPGVLALLHWKWKRFGQAAFYFEFAVYVVMVALTTYVTGETVAAHSYEESEGSGITGLKHSEGWTQVVILAAAGFLLFLEVMEIVSEIRYKRLGHFKGKSAMALMTFGGVIYGFGPAMSGSDTPHSALRFAGGVICILWLYMFQYLALFRTIGPFFIMVIEMVRRDVTKFMMLLMVVIPGFTLATSVMFRVCSEEDFEVSETSGSKKTTVNPEDWDGLVATFYSLALVMFDLQAWPRHNACADGAPAVVLIAFLVLVPMVLVNLLIAMFSETYVRIQGQAIHTWKQWQAQFIMKREMMLPERWRHISREQAPFRFISGREEIFIPGIGDASGGGIYDMAVALMDEIRQLRGEHKIELQKVHAEIAALRAGQSKLACWPHESEKSAHSFWSSAKGKSVGGGAGGGGLGDIIHKVNQLRTENGNGIRRGGTPLGSAAGTPVARPGDEDIPPIQEVSGGEESGGIAGGSGQAPLGGSSWRARGNRVAPERGGSAEHLDARGSTRSIQSHISVGGLGGPSLRALQASGSIGRGDRRPSDDSPGPGQGSVHLQAGGSGERGARESGMSSMPVYNPVRRRGGSRESSGRAEGGGGSPEDGSSGILGGVKSQLAGMLRRRSSTRLNAAGERLRSNNTSGVSDEADDWEALDGPMGSIGPMGSMSRIGESAAIPLPYAVRGSRLTTTGAMTAPAGLPRRRSLGGRPPLDGDLAAPSGGGGTPQRLGRGMSVDSPKAAALQHYAEEAAVAGAHLSRGGSVDSPKSLLLQRYAEEELSRQLPGGGGGGRGTLGKPPPLPQLGVAGSVKLGSIDGHMPARPDPSLADGMNLPSGGALPQLAVAGSVKLGSIDGHMPARPEAEPPAAEESTGEAGEDAGAPGPPLGEQAASYAGVAGAGAGGAGAGNVPPGLPAEVAQPPRVAAMQAAPGRERAFSFGVGGAPTAPTARGEGGEKGPELEEEGGP